MTIISNIYNLVKRPYGDTVELRSMPNSDILKWVKCFSVTPIFGVIYRGIINDCTWLLLFEYMKNGVKNAFSLSGWNWNCLCVCMIFSLYRVFQSSEQDID